MDQPTSSQATGLLKRAEGVVTMILLTLKSEESIRSEREAEEKKKEGKSRLV